MSESLSTSPKESTVPERESAESSMAAKVHHVIFGSRGGSRVPVRVVREFVASLPNDTVVVVSNGTGVDAVALEAAIERCKAGTLAGLIVCPAMWRDWEEMGNVKAAGPIRNSLQARLGDCGTGFKAELFSPGTDDQAAKLVRLGKRVRVLGRPWDWRAK